ncbi:MAG: MFS transporter [Lachnospiraceae bacterium]|nr:MFS transporter [Lachnospiraceae bacterium]
MKEKRAWWIFAGCCMIGLLYVGMICNTAGLYFNDMARELKLPMTQVTLTMSFLNAGGLIGTIFAGILLMKLDVRLLSGLAVLASGGSMILASFSANIIAFYGMWLIIGICTPLLVTILIPTILGNWFSRKLGLVLGVVYGLSGIGGAAFNVVMGQVLAAFGWRMALCIEGGLALAGMLPFALFAFRLRPSVMSQRAVPHQEDGWTEKEARQSKSFYLYLMAALALTIVSSLLQQVSSHISNLGYDITVSALVMSVVMLGCAVGNVSIGSLLDRCPTGAVIGSYSCLGMLGWFGIAFAKEKLLLFLCGILAGFGQAIFQTGLPFCYRKTYGNREFSKICADFSLPGSILAIFSASLGGIIYDHTGSYRFTMLLLGVMFLIAAPCIVKAIQYTGKEG